mmetsp:Transcript_56769/g.122703  ORF Transcript_56769/g.122703 Transcript_56769/m.122703 type:complete len:224 (+) Transcript_56769:222-893(+)
MITVPPRASGLRCSRSVAPAGSNAYSLVLPLPVVKLFGERHLVAITHTALSFCQGRDVAEEVLAAISRLDEAEPLLAIPAKHRPALGAATTGRATCALSVSTRTGRWATVAATVAATVTSTVTATVAASAPGRAVPRAAAATTAAHICCDLNLSSTGLALPVVVLLHVTHGIALLNAALTVHEIRHVAENILAPCVGRDEAKALVAAPSLQNPRRHGLVRANT